MYFITKYARLFTAALLLFALSTTIGQASRITVDAAISGTANGFVIETGNTLVRPGDTGGTRGQR